MAEEASEVYTSYSSLTSYLECGKAWELRRVHKIKGKPAHYLVGGTTLHSYTELIDRGLSLPSIEEMHLEAVAKEEEATGFPQAEWTVGGKASKANPDKEALAWWLENLPLMVDRYVQWREQSNWQVWETHEGKPAIELELNVKLGDNTLKMYIDRVFVLPNGDLVVCDIKTGSRKPFGLLQLGTYSTGLQIQYGIRPDWVTNWMARTGKITGLSNADHFTPGLLSEMFRLFQVGVKNEIFIPKISSSCMNCQVKRACHVMGGGLDSEIDPLSQLDAEF